ncbi:helix-turn-helix transcriptional regulator [Methylobacterium ajmalii]|jgi:transcriptional regulator with XRE-family HTH domain|uniref:helix-turn-helix transcriptional regulator n=1 Tax=Methylobacterium ajmalii TaxID=2738439 RepID=UPI00190B99B2|nr:helix-turn-helix transcriptional regulator [Methylobacterium ajmalii]MBK3396691.1 helix-turn-helix domain-containing protein [Methylobacterium ajmalii]MBK3412743.1 helix-turn-helix domain-containing protein [Methylobacterium ajmalii]MBK3422863.1 helix-turn-helix domain-containing protein [Methylobacterium ajmalii]MBZ6416996.1 helix-turn-helix transcriptional regulator [Methylobacterium sp.]
MSDPHQKALGDFLRARRAALDPKVLAVAAVRQRRTPGLRRDEVAQRAGISIDWYVRLEQGRSVSPSMATIDALARALCLNTAEHAHLRALAHGPQRHRFVKEQIPATLDRLIGSLNQPAYVTGRRWDLLTWNAAAADLFAFDDLHEAERNILLFVLTDARARSLFGEAWAQEAQRMTAQFRATHDLWAADPAFTDLLARLQKGCTQFQAWWQAHEVRPSGTGRKLLHHPQRGSLSFEYSTFQANEDPALKLAIYVPITT